ncbi:hypothetical protein BC941DRAFT_473469 [Chlamydoabsidia padenii]|nr:hypothetical protein BC941DRAFT_473469 [Chlamydoabsidia padenii]
MASRKSSRVRKTKITLDLDDPHGFPATCDKLNEWLKEKIGQLSSDAQQELKPYLPPCDANEDLVTALNDNPYFWSSLEEWQELLKSGHLQPSKKALTDSDLLNIPYKDDNFEHYWGERMKTQQVPTKPKAKARAKPKAPAKEKTPAKEKAPARKGSRASTGKAKGRPLKIKVVSEQPNDTSDHSQYEEEENNVRNPRTSSTTKTPIRIRALAPLAIDPQVEETTPAQVIPKVADTEDALQSSYDTPDDPPLRKRSTSADDTYQDFGQSKRTRGMKKST